MDGWHGSFFLVSFKRSRRFRHCLRGSTLTTEQFIVQKSGYTIFPQSIGEFSTTSTRDLVLLPMPMMVLVAHYGQ